MKIKLSLKSPVVLGNINEKTFIAHLTSQPLFEDTDCGIILPIIYDIIEFGTVQNGKVNRPNLNPMNLLDSKTAQLMYIVKAKIGYLGNSLSQKILNDLKEVNNNFRELEEFQYIFKSQLKKTSKLTNEEFNLLDKNALDDLYKKLDFMAHRGIFSEILNSNKLDYLKVILEKYDVKSLTSTFFNFIGDRNIYVHGILKFWPTKKKTLIEYEIKGKKIYTEVNKDILNSFIKCYHNLNDLLSEISLKQTEKLPSDIDNKPFEFSLI